MENLDILMVINLYSMYKEILSILFYVPDTLAYIQHGNCKLQPIYLYVVC